MIRQKKRAHLELFFLCFAVFSVFAITAQAEEETRHDEEATSASKIPGAVPAAKPESLRMGNPNGRAAVPFGAVHNDAANRERTQEHPQWVQQQRQGVQEHYPGIQQRRQIVREHHEFHERDVHRFNHEELALWRGGRWNNSCYGGRCGWWWFAGGEWYFYEHPIYPYPLEVSLDTYVESVQEAPVVAVPATPVVQHAPAPVFAAQPHQQVWYFCATANAYYPYVSSCPSGWQTVPATPLPNSLSNQSAAPPQ
ncbi:MAG: hypothetical protein ACLQHK_01145 [Gallionellaceae bacterium]